VEPLPPPPAAPFWSPGRRAGAALLLGAGAGLVLGLGGYTFVYAKGYSYLTNDPGACANCHGMQDHYDAWMKSSHRSVATCNDCHTPEGLIPKYATKASNGFWHSFYFTTGAYPDRIRLRPRNVRIVDDACIKCHGGIAGDLGLHGEVPAGEACIRCHNQVGHMR
jgi:cytochrome c nitrite reductase small subunit